MIILLDVYYFNYHKLFLIGLQSKHIGYRFEKKMMQHFRGI